MIRTFEFIDGPLDGQTIEFLDVGPTTTPVHYLYAVPAQSPGRRHTYSSYYGAPCEPIETHIALEYRGSLDEDEFAATSGRHRRINQAMQRQQNAGSQME
jgi:hypothetical protein